MIKMYRVGGCVRDILLGLNPKDIDYAVEAPSYQEMKEYILELDGKIYQERPEYFTIRGRVNGEDVDFVLCRKESAYTDGRRPDSVDVGTILDDLARRDFTINAMAADIEKGELIDPYNGQEDLKKKIIRCVGNPEDRFREDSLRMLRAIRFSITKQFSIDPWIEDFLHNRYYIESLDNAKIERWYDEIKKCFSFSTVKTLEVLGKYPDLTEKIFRNNTMWLEPTLRNA